MNILVAGATGIIGRRVVPLLVGRGHSVTALGRSRERMARLADAGASTGVVDLFDRLAVRRAVEGHEVVVNLATRIPTPGVRAFLPGAWRENDRIRREGSAIIADAAIAAGVRRVVQESFALIYPDSGDRWVDETLPPSPAVYNRSVLDAEASASRVTEAGRAGIVLRFALLYGAQDDPFTRDLVRYARRGTLALFGWPGAYTPLVTHDDAARAVVAALDAPAGIYNVVDDEPLPRQSLGVILGDLLAGPIPKLPPRWVARLAGSIGETISRSLRLSNAKLRSTTGWAPQDRSVREGLARYLVASAPV